MRDASRRNCIAITLAGFFFGFLGMAEAQNAPKTVPTSHDRIEGLKQQYSTAANPASPSPVPVGDVATSHPGKDWQVWSAYYASLEFYNQNSPSRLRAVFANRGVGGPNVEAVLTIGRKFLDEIRSIDAGSKTEINGRFGVSRRIEVADPDASAHEKLPNPLLDISASLNVKSGRSLTDELEVDGTAARQDGDRSVAVQNSKRELRKVLGDGVAQRVEDWVNAEVAPKVREVDQMIAAAPEAVPSTASDSITAGGR